MPSVLRSALLALGVVPLASGQLQTLSILTPGQTKTTSTPAAPSSTTASISSLPTSSTPPSSSIVSSQSSSSTATTTDDPLVLTTIFTQPTDCATGITEIAAWSTELWQNIVNPVPSLTLSSCYPSQFYYSAVATSVLPPFKDLVCPLNWETYQVNSTYLICCPSGYGLYAPNYYSTERPGLDAVCTSDVWPNVLIDITSYDATGLATTIATSAGDNGTLVFATAFDGTLAAHIATSPPSPASSSHFFSSTSIPTSSTSSSSARSSSPASSSASSTTTSTLTAISQLLTCGVRVSLPVLVFMCFLLGELSGGPWSMPRLALAARLPMTEANHAWDLNNSCSGPLRVPGFGGIPVDYQLPVDARFAHGVREWRQSPMVTAQESAMVAVMDRLTDKPTWYVDVFDDAIVAQWRRELGPGPLHRESPPDERREDLGLVCAGASRQGPSTTGSIGTSRCWIPGPASTRPTLPSSGPLARCSGGLIAPLAHQYEANRERRERREQLERSQMNRFGQDAGQQAQADDHELIENGYTVNNGAPAVEESEEMTEGEEDEEASHMITDAQNASDNQQAVEDGRQGEDYNTTWHPNMVEDESDDDLSEPRFMFDDDLADVSDMEDDDEGNNGEDDDIYWDWSRQTRPVREGKILDFAGSAHMISAFVDPLLFPLVYGRTLVLQQGGLRHRSAMLISCANHSAARYGESPTVIAMS
ncbi:hypothetical protein CONLIGDRAFT_705794 [Coniochaeta ligniaria NRRL 30616]|uniref:DUF4246 domain-containing protein n=1 Tax=Coniochaeta ligniaria NRRL 30616 TaxID=1408157 RepID=A0A1J7JDQ8_9PEZI|nr:hypothetical protein CONLIGDRAFT_705794 [Coniochaeta ligniaria NRRL 30616]